MTLERAAELLAERRAAGPRTPRRARATKRTATRKSAVKRTAVKKIAAKKSVAKNTAARKSLAKKSGGEEIRRQEDGGEGNPEGEACPQDGRTTDLFWLNGSVRIAANSRCRSVGNDGRAWEIHRPRGR